ncbi:hypothetical protein [Lactiplantibacillus plantarum]|uniref:hypothetical protein n=1 Tax=Lactiplantibacillus plantarum TaxID=1590 RepID=UPI002010E439|nr:hypothetical protein [Lactiplantibacillus plantarum]
MHHAKKLVVALTSLLILTGCTTGNQQAANHTSVKTKTVRVEKRTAANKAAWAKAKAASRLTRPQPKLLVQTRPNSQLQLVRLSVNPNN